MQHLIFVVLFTETLFFWVRFSKLLIYIELNVFTLCMKLLWWVGRRFAVPAEGWLLINEVHGPARAGGGGLVLVNVNEIVTG